MSSSSSQSPIKQLRVIIEHKNLNPPFPLSDQLLQRFLWTKKTPKKALVAVSNYVDFLNNELVKMTQYSFDELLPGLDRFLPTPEYLRDKNGFSCFFMRSKGYNPSEIGVDIWMLTMFLNAEVRFQSTEVQEAGLNIFFDLKGFGYDNFSAKAEKKNV